MYASILGIPALIGWYITGYQTLISPLQAGPKNSVPSLLMGAFVLFAIVALVANAVAYHGISRHRSIDKAIAPTAPREVVSGLLDNSSNSLSPNELKRIITMVEPGFARHADATYKSKLVVNLTNSGNKPIHCLQQVSWLCQRGDVGLQTNIGFGYWVYPKGSANWVDNIADPVIGPDERFHIWVGLDQNCSDTDLNNRRRAGRLGTLRMPIEIEGKQGTFELRL
jgi:hypothetical protein